MQTDYNSLFVSREEREDHWISISDLMAGLMMIFMFIAISYMVKVSIESQQIKDIAITYEILQTELYEDLLAEFKSDLARWNAEIDRATLSVKFKEPEVLFEAGQSRLQPRFEDILQSFFPRYVNILMGDKYQNEIEEVRIEGHTSSEWENATPMQSYFNNMQLSQDRTRSVLEYVMTLKGAFNGVKKKWLIEHVTANGLSYSHRVFTRETDKEDRKGSRRVEFRVRTKAEKRIARILGKEV